MQSALTEGRYVHQNLGCFQGDSRTEIFEILDRYGVGPDPNDINAIIVVRRISIAHTRWWRVYSSTDQFFDDDIVRPSPNWKYPWTSGRYNAQSFETTSPSHVWNQHVWRGASIVDFYSARAETLGIGRHRAVVREHVFVLEYKALLDG